MTERLSLSVVLKFCSTFKFETWKCKIGKKLKKYYLTVTEIMNES